MERENGNRRFALLSSRFAAPLLMLSLMLFTSSALAQENANDSSVYHLIEGVYYLIDQNQPNLAMPFFQKAIALDSSNPDPYYFLGTSYYRLQQPAYALFYLYEAEKQKVEHDQFRPNLIPEIQEKYPGIQPMDPNAPLTSGEVRIIVQSNTEKGRKIVVQGTEGIAEYQVGDEILLEGGKHYTVGLKKKRGLGYFLKRVVLVGSVIGIWALR